MLPAIRSKKGSLTNPSFDDIIDRFFYGWPSMERDVDTIWNPRVDVNETENEITIHAELPGIDKKDVNIEVKDSVLTLSGERKQEKKDKGTNYHRVERRYGKFERSFGLPDYVLSEKITAEYNNGVLTLTLPKAEKEEPKKLSIPVK